MTTSGLRRLALLAALFPVIGQAALAQERHALLIGLNDYLYQGFEVQELKYAIDDVNELKEVLEEKHDFRVVPLRNDDAERGDIIAQLGRYARILDEDDTFLLYFAGHGVRNALTNSETYWLSYDAQPSSIEVYGIRVRHLLDYLKDIKASRKIILLDHCFSGDIVSLADTLGGARGGGEVGALEAGARAGDAGASLTRGAFSRDNFRDEIQTSSQGILIVAAARGESYELDDLKHGLFTHVLLNALKNGDGDDNDDGQLSVGELKAHLVGELRRVSETRIDLPTQEAIEYSRGINFEGPVFTVPRDAGATEAAAARYRTELAQWEQQGLIDLNLKLRSMDAVDAWKRHELEDALLSRVDEQIAGRVRALIDQTTASPSTRAHDLKEFVARVEGPGS